MPPRRGPRQGEALRFTPRARTAGPEQTKLALAGLRTSERCDSTGFAWCYTIVKTYIHMIHMYKYN